MQALPAGLATRYRLVSVLGSGGFGTVLLAEDRELRRKVAIKVLKDRLDLPEVRARFRREARITAGLCHRHVVPVFDFGGADEEGTDEGAGAGGSPYIVYEWIDGVDLGEAYRATGPEVRGRSLARWIGELADALDAAHRAGVLHRDVKPENAMVRSAGQAAVLVDFGIAKLPGSATVATQEGLVLGTPAFMAPELFQGKAASAASDQFALAATVSVLAGGGWVWGSREVGPILEAAGRGQAPGPAPGALEFRGLGPVLARALATDPERRYPDCRAFAADLGRVLGSAGPSPAPGDPITRAATTRVAGPEGIASPVPAPRPGPGERAVPGSRSAVWLAGWSALVVLVVLVVLGLGLRPGPGGAGLRSGIGPDSEGPGSPPGSAAPGTGTAGVTGAEREERQRQLVRTLAGVAGRLEVSTRGHQATIPATHVEEVLGDEFLPRLAGLVGDFSAWAESVRAEERRLGLAPGAGFESPESVRLVIDTLFGYFPHVLEDLDRMTTGSGGVDLFVRNIPVPVAPLTRQIEAHEAMLDLAERLLRTLEGGEPWWLTTFRSMLVILGPESERTPDRLQRSLDQLDSVVSSGSPGLHHWPLAWTEVGLGRLVRSAPCDQILPWICSQAARIRAMEAQGLAFATAWPRVLLDDVRLWIRRCPDRDAGAAACILPFPPRLVETLPPGEAALLESALGDLLGLAGAGSGEAGRGRLREALRNEQARVAARLMPSR